MAVHLTEEEQLETLKRWWAENGKSTVVGVVLAVAAYLGWNFWQDQKQVSAEAASAQYQMLLEAVQVQPGTKLPEEKLATAKHLADELKSASGGSLYASLGAMVKAKALLESGEAEAAAAELQWVIDRNTDAALTNTAKMRLARLQMAAEEYAAALQTVADTDDISYKGAFAEVRGDVLVAQGKTSDARAAYQLALDYLVQDLESRRPLLEMKLQDLQAAVPVAPAGSEGESAPAGADS
ncbi:tetratricopeptide repeat protein [Pseudomaricurvus sp. HS19]|uniref:YfgM family protein n=1 Tax=Pseudomaricurvus sp. HS19 TaxID=2692626 RepID=UPI0013700FB2|nr:tetratricopeptide repeat protein [Pseudomaricurvus sp. HS19]